MYFLSTIEGRWLGEGKSAGDVSSLLVSDVGVGYRQAVTRSEIWLTQLNTCECLETSLCCILHIYYCMKVIVSVRIVYIQTHDSDERNITFTKYTIQISKYVVRT